MIVPINETSCVNLDELVHTVDDGETVVMIMTNGDRLGVEFDDERAAAIMTRVLSELSAFKRGQTTGLGYPSKIASIANGEMTVKRLVNRRLEEADDEPG